MTQHRENCAVLFELSTLDRWKSVVLKRSHCDLPQALRHGPFFSTNLRLDIVAGQAIPRVFAAAGRYTLDGEVLPDSQQTVGDVRLPDIGITATWSWYPFSYHAPPESSVGPGREKSGEHQTSSRKFVHEPSVYTPGLRPKAGALSQ